MASPVVRTRSVYQVRRSDCPGIIALGGSSRRYGAGRDAVTGGNHGLELFDHVPDVDGHGRRHRAVAEPEGGELATVDVAADHDVVVRCAVADVLHAQV